MIAAAESKCLWKDLTIEHDSTGQKTVMLIDMTPTVKAYKLILKLE